jgi:membrane peptidoglycan carboxypeptidase
MEKTKKKRDTLRFVTSWIMPLSGPGVVTGEKPPVRLPPPGFAGIKGRWPLRTRAIKVQQRKKRPGFRPFLIWLLVSALVPVAVLLYDLKTSRVQALIFSHLCGKYSYSTNNAPSTMIRFPAQRPYDKRLGYSDIPLFVQRLRNYGFAIESQARLSEPMAKLYDNGINLPYDEKQQAGLRIFDRVGRDLYRTDFPLPVYGGFDSIPPLIVQSLLTIEDQNLLDPEQEYRNPAIDWGRFLLAVSQLAASKIGAQDNVPGASTLATQIEKYRHSSMGLTISPDDKIRQMISASIRAYQFGEHTLEARKKIILDYINTSPLKAFPGYGEVFGIGEGMSVWYGVPFDSLNRALTRSTAPLAEQGRVYRMVLSLIIAHRRPELYLNGDTTALSAKTNYYLRVIHNRGIISDSLYLAALRAPLILRSPSALSQKPVAFEMQKSANSIRGSLEQMLGLPGLYDLDRLDLGVESTLDSLATARITAFFLRLKHDPAFLDSLKLRTSRMLDKGDPADIVYSFNLYEKKDGGNLVRIQADSYDAPLDFNAGIKLDLGSTAKLRTLITYLEIIEDLHRQLSPLGYNALQAVAARDPLTTWAKSYLLNAKTDSLQPMLQAALDRRYSANPGERFFTAGGMHHFDNFDGKHNGMIMPVREGFRFSVNLVFIRLMRDIVNYYVARLPGSEEFAKDTTGKKREEYINQFVAFESGVFLSRFYQQLRNIPSAGMADSLVAGIRSSKGRLAAIYCTVEKNPTPDGLKKFLVRHDLIDTNPEVIARLFSQNQAFSLSDRGYVAGVHPLKLWAASYLVRNPSAGLRELKAAAVPYLHGVYGWIFSPRRVAFQNSRIRIMMEMEAFVSIHQQWRRLGYPFAELVPSYATALGASADRPSALAELAGIIQNQGMKCPQKRIQRLHFAANTPYETVLCDADSDECVRGMSADVAQTVRSCMRDVVENGTAIRACKAFDSTITVGGKTGTGDHRQLCFGKNGRLIGQKSVSRAGTFVFVIGDRFFGTINVAVLGAAASHFDFTSSYPVQLFVYLAPILRPLIETAETAHYTLVLGARP